MTDDNDVVIAHTIRGGHLDCMHYGSVVVVNQSGNILFSAGNFRKLVYERSLPKPYKAIGVVNCGAASQFGFGTTELALISGSISGSKFQIEKLQNMLSILDLPITSLKCGAELPIGTDAIQELVADFGIPISPLHCDCSGEHIGHLAVCQHFGWSIDNYEQPDHQIQKYFREIVDNFIEYSTNIFTIDGCGLPTYYVPLINLAKGMANLCNPKKYIEAAKYVVNSIIQAPQYFAGPVGRYDTNLISASGGSIISKCGAEGLYALGWPDKGIGMAIKVADGNHRAASPVIASIIEQLGLAPKEIIKTISQKTAELIITNDGLEVGYVKSVI